MIKGQLCFVLILHAQHLYEHRNSKTYILHDGRSCGHQLIHLLFIGTNYQSATLCVTFLTVFFEDLKDFRLMEDRLERYL